jgi:hypothetical protein
LDALGDSLVKNGELKISAFFKNGRLASIEHGAGRRAEGQCPHFLLKGQTTPNQSFAIGRNFNSDGGFHKTSVLVRRKGNPYLA